MIATTLLFLAQAAPATPNVQPTPTAEVQQVAKSVPGDPPDPYSEDGELRMEKATNKRLSGALRDAIRENIQLQAEAAQLKQDAASVRSPEVVDETRDQLVSFLRDEYKGSKTDIYMDGPYVVVRIPEAEYSSGQLTASAALRKALTGVRKAAIKYGAQFDALVEGHADRTPVRKSSKYADNWSVAFERARNVADTLEGGGLGGSSIGIVSRGDHFTKGVKNARRVLVVFAPRRNDPSRGQGAPDNAAKLQKIVAKASANADKSASGDKQASANPTPAVPKPEPPILPPGAQKTALADKDKKPPTPDAPPQPTKKPEEPKNASKLPPPLPGITDIAAAATTEKQDNQSAKKPDPKPGDPLKTASFPTSAPALPPPIPPGPAAVTQNKENPSSTSADNAGLPAAPPVPGKVKSVPGFDQPAITASNDLNPPPLPPTPGAGNPVNPVPSPPKDSETAKGTGSDFKIVEVEYDPDEVIELPVLPVSVAPNTRAPAGAGDLKLISE